MNPYPFDVPKMAAAADWEAFAAAWPKVVYDVHNARFEWLGRTALQLAVIRRAPPEIIRALLEKDDVARASVECRGSIGRTPLELAIADYDVFNDMRGFRRTARSAERAAAVVRVLLERGAAMDRNTLRYAARSPPEVVRVLVEHGARDDNWHWCSAACWID